MPLRNTGGLPKKKQRMMMLRSFIQIALIAVAITHCDGQNITSVPTVAPNATSAVPVSVATFSPSSTVPPDAPSQISERPSLVASFSPSRSALQTSKRPSLAPSLRPSVSQLPSSRKSDSPSLQPSVSAAPSSSLAPSTQPSSPPSEKPSTSPTSSFKPSLSVAPTSSFEPSTSVMPSSLPSSFPSQIPSAAPSASSKPSSPPTLMPSPSPTTGPSDHPSRVPSDIPSVVPTESFAPSVFPSDVPSSVPTISLSPSEGPSKSFQPSASLEPSIEPSGHPTVSTRPSDLPSGIPTQTPTASPTIAPSSEPSSQPTVPVMTVSHPFLVMTLEGLMDNFSPSEIADWEVATSNHVHDFWEELPFSPLYVGRVATRLLSQARILPTNSTETSRQTTYAPLQILYEQNATFGFLVDELDDRLVPASDSVFLEPFRVDSGPYVREIITFTENQGPVYLDSVEIRTPPPTPAPTQAPEIGGNDNDERRIILIVVFVVGTAVLSAIAYIIYLTRKENLDSPISDGPLALEDYGSDSGNDIYYMSNSMPQSPSSTQVLANIGQSASFESDVIDSPSVRSAYSDTRSQDMDAMADARRLHERSISLPSSSLPTIDDPDALAAHQLSIGSFPTTLEDRSDVMQFSEPSMEGFNLQIEDIED